MSKQASTRFPIHNLIAERWSPVGFSTRPVEAEKLGDDAEHINEQPAFM